MTTARFHGDSAANGTEQPPSSALRGFSAEFRLMLACLRWPLDDASLDRVAEESRAVQNWPHLLNIATRHRVLGLVWRALHESKGTIPPQIAVQFQQASATAARQAMFLSVESLRLSGVLQKAGIEATFLKGAVIASLAYGDVAVRHAKDIDLLLPDVEVPHALSVLRDAGYLPLFDLHSVSPSRRALWFRYAKSIDLQHGTSGVLLELHWRMTDLPLAGTFQPVQQQVAVMANRSLRALPTDELLAYLCVHGAAHGWMRLKWLADVYALLRRGSDVEAAYQRLLQLGAGRAAGQAFLLCHDLLDLPLPPALFEEMQRDGVLRLLRQSPARLYRRGHEVSEVDDLSFGTTSVYLSRMLLGSGVRGFFIELRTWAFRPDELLKTRLPRPLFFLFPLVRIGTWAKARLQHRGRSAPQTNG